MELNPDQKLQILCAAVQGAIVAMPNQIEGAPAKIAERAVVVATLTIAELNKKPLF